MSALSNFLKITMHKGTSTHPMEVSSSKKVPPIDMLFPLLAYMHIETYLRIQKTIPRVINAALASHPMRNLYENATKNINFLKKEKKAIQAYAFKPIECDLFYKMIQPTVSPYIGYLKFVNPYLGGYLERAGPEIVYYAYYNRSINMLYDLNFKFFHEEHPHAYNPYSEGMFSSAFHSISSASIPYLRCAEIMGQLNYIEALNLMGLLEHIDAPAHKDDRVTLPNGRIGNIASGPPVLIQEGLYTKLPPISRKFAIWRDRIIRILSRVAVDHVRQKDTLLLNFIVNTLLPISYDYRRVFILSQSIYVDLDLWKVASQGELIEVFDTLMSASKDLYKSVDFTDAIPQIISAVASAGNITSIKYVLGTFFKGYQIGSILKEGQFRILRNIYSLDHDYGKVLQDLYLSSGDKKLFDEIIAYDEYYNDITKNTMERIHALSLEKAVFMASYDNFAAFWMALEHNYLAYCSYVADLLVRYGSTDGQKMVFKGSQIPFTSILETPAWEDKLIFLFDTFLYARSEIIVGGGYILVHRLLLEGSKILLGRIFSYLTGSGSALGLNYIDFMLSDPFRGYGERDEIKLLRQKFQQISSGYKASFK